MERIVSTPRPEFGQKLESIGLSFWNWDSYWREDACYKFTAAEVDVLEEAAFELHAMCVKAVRFAIDNNRLGDLQIPKEFHDVIKKSFESDAFSLYGRFDFAYDGKSAPKMLEYNADTPTSILESAVAQWYWLEDKNVIDNVTNDQFNSLHEKFVERWKQLPQDTVHFATIPSDDASFEEDWVAITYLMETAAQAGKNVIQLSIDQVGWDSAKKIFVDMQNREIACLFKLYPWEWMMREEFGAHVVESKTQFIEPIWKSVLSNKGILPLLWELFPGHPNLLEAHFEHPHGMESYAKKPIFSREGANIELVRNGELLQKGTDSRYGEEGHIYQALYDMPCFDGRYPVIGAWIVGDQPAGMCLREDVAPITTNLSNFVPHFFN